jgi:hypothetical protein
MTKYNVGDTVRYQTVGVQTINHGRQNPQIKEGIIIEYFPSLSGDDTCFWIEGEIELIRKSQILKHVGGKK